MTAVERVQTTFDGGKPDRIPAIPKIWVDLAAAITGTDLCRVIEDPLTALQVIVEAGLGVGADAVRQFHFPARKTERDTEGRVYEVDERGRRMGQIDMLGGLATRLEDASLFRPEDPACVAFYRCWRAEEPFVKDLSDARRLAPPDETFWEQAGCGDRQRRVMEYAGDRVALIGDCDSATLAFYVGLRGMERAMLDMIEAPELVHAVMEKGEACAIGRGKFNVDLGLRVLRLNDSAANMSVISPRQWREFIFPHMKAVCDELHAYCPEAKIYCHICGNVMPIMDDLMAAGLDCIAPLDPLGGFAVAEARAAVGEEFVLMGGVDTQSFVNASAEETMNEARRCIIEGSREGRYVLGSGCVIPRTAKVENVRALRQAAERWGTVGGGEEAAG